MSSSKNTKGTTVTLPTYCQYTMDKCDQDLSELSPTGTFFIFPNEPGNISATIQFAIENLRRYSGSRRWTSWKDLSVAGKIIFCEICKAIRAADLIVADITTLNFNVLFEIGYAIGIGIPVILIRDT